MTDTDAETPPEPDDLLALVDHVSRVAGTIHGLASLAAPALEGGAGRHSGCCHRMAHQ